MASTIEVKGTIVSIDRMKSSEYGNPRFRITLDNGAQGVTRKDADMAYGVSDSWVGRPVRMRVQAGKGILSIDFTDE